jgi:phosphoadenosine phosphosulfate reductase
MRFTPTQIQQLNTQFESTPTESILKWAWETFGSRAAIGTSFQGAGLVMIHLAQQAKVPLSVFTLDTGLLFPETLDLKKRLEAFFKISIESLEPELAVEAQAAKHGPELWKRDPDSCCVMRKVEPLQKKLANLDCWITGLRRQQSETRSQIGIIEVYEFDPIMNREIVKLNPMAQWKREDVWDYLKRHQIPYNPLHDQGYRSIGCIPCTSKASGGEDERAGRWIGFSKTECGIHTFMKKKGD